MFDWLNDPLWRVLSDIAIIVGLCWVAHNRGYRKGQRNAYQWLFDRLAEPLSVSVKPEEMSAICREYKLDPPPAFDSDGVLKVTPGRLNKKLDFPL